MAEIVTRKRAIELGLKCYFSGKPCPHGHVAERYVASFSCVVCQVTCGSKWKNENREDWNRRRRLRRAANRSKFRARDKVYDACRDGTLIIKPKRGTGALLANLKPDQCRCVIRAPTPPHTFVSDRSGELERFKETLPLHSVCCGAPVLLGFKWCPYHYAAVCDAEAMLEKATARWC
jgi:hypothetical protein